jgi:hypothetical protein
LIAGEPLTPPHGVRECAEMLQVRALLQPVTVRGRIFAHVHVDLVDPLPVSRDRQNNPVG